MSRPLRIAFLLGSFPVVSETFILRQITGLLDLGHDVRLFADARPDGNAPVHPEVAKYNLLDRTTYVDGPAESVVWELPVWPLTGQTWPPGADKSVANWRRLAAAWPVALRCLCHSPRLTRQLLSRAEYGYQAASGSGLYRLATLSQHPGGFDVLHAHFGPVGNSFRFARSLWKAPLVVSFHGYDFSTQPRKQGAGMYQKLFGGADVITVNSDFTRARVATLGCPAGKLRKLPVGLALDEFAFRERRWAPGQTLRLLTVARLTEIKGHEFILRAVARLRNYVPALRYDVVGEGPLRKQLEALTDDLGLKDMVTFHGAVVGDPLMRLLAEAHLFLLCSVNVEGDQEGQGLALQEAQACGLPVIATRHGALPEGLREGRSGWLVPEHDPEAIADQLRILLERTAEWPAFGRAGRAFVEDGHDILKLNEQLVRLYLEAIEDFRC